MCARGSQPACLIFDMGPFSWFICCLVLWIMAVPAYLAKRGQLTAAAVTGETKTCPFCAETIL